MEAICFDPGHSLPLLHDLFLALRRRPRVVAARDLRAVLAALLAGLLLAARRLRLVDDHLECLRLAAVLGGRLLLLLAAALALRAEKLHVLDAGAVLLLALGVVASRFLGFLGAGDLGGALLGAVRARAGGRRGVVVRGLHAGARATL